ncbi:MAG: magnesium transporter [Clostridiaceae bacterium]
MREELLELIEKNDFSRLRRTLEKLEPADIAQFLDELDQKHLLVIFRILPKELAAETFSHLNSDSQKHIIELSSDHEIRYIINELFIDDAVDFIEEMPANVVKKIISNTTEETRNLINQFLKYPDNSVGTLMTIEYVDLKKEMTVRQALDHIKKIGIDKETINTCYVLEKNRIMAGTVSIRRLILSDDNVLVNDIMDPDIIMLNTTDDQEEAAAKFRKYDFLVMPVVDSEKRLVGIVTIDDIVDVIQKENTEDLQKMAAMQPSEKEYLKTDVFTLAKHRIPWLLILMISATFTGGIIRKYETALQSVMILATFIPMLMDTGGNAGSQSSTLVIRGMALDEIKLKDFLKVLWKELQVSLIVGFVLSTVNFLRLYFFEKVDFMVALTVCITLVFTVVMAKIVGGILPIIAKKVKIDPAIMASPLITTIVDAFTLIIYFTIAGALLHI